MRLFGYYGNRGDNEDILVAMVTIATIEILWFHGNNANEGYFCKDILIALVLIAAIRIHRFLWPSW